MATRYSVSVQLRSLATESGSGSASGTTNASSDSGGSAGGHSVVVHASSTSSTMSSSSTSSTTMRSAPTTATAAAAAARAPVPVLRLPRQRGGSTAVSPVRPQTAGSHLIRCPVGVHAEPARVVPWVRDDVRLCLDCGFAWLARVALQNTLPLCHRKQCRAGGAARPPYLRIENHFGTLGYACIACQLFVPLTKWTAHAKKNAKKMAAARDAYA